MLKATHQKAVLLVQKPRCDKMKLPSLSRHHTSEWEDTVYVDMSIQIAAVLFPMDKLQPHLLWDLLAYFKSITIGDGMKCCRLPLSN